MDASKLLAKTQLREQHFFSLNLRMLCCLFPSFQIRLPVKILSALTLCSKNHHALKKKKVFFFFHLINQFNEM